MADTSQEKPSSNVISEVVEGMDTSPKVSERGLLDLSIELSTKDLTAGKEFSVFVLVKNPFNDPIWIDRVHVSVPSDLEQAISEKAKAQIEKEQQRLADDAAAGKALQKALSDLRNELSVISSKRKNESDQDLAKSVSELRKLLEQEEKTTAARIEFGGDLIADKLSVGASRSQIWVAGNATVRDLEFFEPALKKGMSQDVDLESSLPAGAALQPGCTAVYTRNLNVRRSIIFPPTKYRLQFNVVYRFDHILNSSSSVQVDQEVPVFANTLASEVSIRPSVFSVILGSVIGGLTGSIGRILQLSGLTDISTDVLSVGGTLFLSVLLSAIAVIFMARKSDAQSFVSIEDFWGGLLIGFLVGYTGTSFFSELTGVEAPRGSPIS